MKTKSKFLFSFAATITQLSAAQPADHLVFEGKEGLPGFGKHIVLMAGDEEYKSEEAMPMLAQILAKQGFKCSVLFSMDKNNKFVDPTNQKSLSHSSALDSADAVVMSLRFRNYEDKDMAKFNAAFERGTPVIALRTSTHAFNIKAKGKFGRYSFRAKKDLGWEGGFGGHVLGTSWVNHHGKHKKEGCRSYVEKGSETDPILNGVGTIFCESDVYGVKKATPNAPSKVLLRGGVTKTLKKDSGLVEGEKNAPMMPVAWTREFKHPSGKVSKILTTTMGASIDLLDENLRRLVINGVYWGTGLTVPKKADVKFVSTYKPTFYGFKNYKKNMKPADFIELTKEEGTVENKKKIKVGKAAPGNVRYVRISLKNSKRLRRRGLALAEVKVISAGSNIARAGKATQSSTVPGCEPEKAIDGNTNSSLKGKSIASTAGGKEVWWEVDLGQNVSVDEVQIYSRKGGRHVQRFDYFNIQLLSKDRKAIFSKGKIRGPREAITIKPKVGSKLSYNKGYFGDDDFVQEYVILEGLKHPKAVKNSSPGALNLLKNSRIGFVGGGLGSRMNIYNEFETELHRRYPQHNLYIRNFCHEGDTPAFRPHPSRISHWVLNSLKDKGSSLMNKEFQKGRGAGHYETPDQWLNRHSIDTIIGFFGYTASFNGLATIEIDRFKTELRAFITHTLKAKYTKNGAQLAIVGPAAFENLTAKYDLPNGVTYNKNFAAYTAAMKAVCKEEGVLFVDAYMLTSALYAKSEDFLTSNGHNLKAEGYKQFSPLLADKLFGSKSATGDYKKIKFAVSAKNKLWLNDYKIPNGVHVHGRRYKPYGNKNYPDEIKKNREKTEIRDQAIWAISKGKSFDVAAADAKTHSLRVIKTNSSRPNVYKTGKEVEGMLKLAPGYKVELFACEKSFPDLQNPSQMAFDNAGRLWVSCMSSYPHWKVGDPEPNDKIIILEDTDGDNKADKQTTFIDNIHIPMGFEITEHGVFVSLGKNLVLFKDTDGDSKADVKEVVLSGFDDHDTHHAISSFCADPSGAIYMAEGTFLHSNVETPYGTVRGTNGGFYRYNPKKMHLERTAQYSIPNPWGIAFNDWGQNFFLHTSNTKMSWMQQGAVKSRYNVNLKSDSLLTSNTVRPTSGIEFVSSRHFPDEVQGDFILCNNIGFLGAKQHKMIDDEKSGFFKTEFRHDLFVSPSSYQYFRPVDLEFAPDGSLYFIDWSNVLIGHMQHNARDPKRDHVHGRVYRITYPSRPLVKPAKIVGASINELLDNLKVPEIRTRYRTRRELRGRDVAKVTAAIPSWIKSLDTSDKRYEHHLLEALWVSWGVNSINKNLLEKLLKAKDFRARTAAVRAVRYNASALNNAGDFILAAAGDVHPQVRHEAIIQASWMEKDLGLSILAVAKKAGIPKISNNAYNNAKRGLEQAEIIIKPKKVYPSGILKDTKSVTSIQINCVEKNVKFDVNSLNVKVGKKLKILFNNPDDMQHNLLIVKPGTADAVAQAAFTLGPDGNKLNWIPEHDGVIQGSRLLNKGQKQSLEITFDKPGKYPFICSFPGHAGAMRGYFIVK